MDNKKTAILTKGPIKATLINLSVPMIFGLLGMVAFNLVDTFFVSQLGTKQLAALSFTFPVVLVIGSITLGLGFGTSSIISKSIGEGDHKKAEQLTSASLLLSSFLAVFFVIFGYFTLTPVFSLLGAKNSTIPLIGQYMYIWYAGLIFVVVPMIGNNILRATGDTKTPSILMLISFSVNMILDPILIFGWGPFPRLELAGAAIATVFARGITFIITLWVLIFREKLLKLSFPKIRDLIASWKQILYIGIPTVATRLVFPFAIGIITKIISFYGPEAVAAFGISSKIELFAMIVIMALASVIGPFVGQNWGAGELKRLRKGIRYGEKVSLLWGSFVFVLLYFTADHIAHLFSKNPNIIAITTLYLKIASLGFGLQGVLIIVATSLIVLNKPFHTSALVLFEMFILYVPLAFLGSKYFGINGIFYAIAISYSMAGIVSHLLINSILKKKFI